MEMEHRDRPNPHAKVAFIIYYPFQFYVYKDVYKHLADQAEFVIDLGVFFPIRQTDDVLSAITALLEKHGAHYRILQYEDYYYAKYLKRFFSKYDTLISTWFRGCMQLSVVQEKKKVHMTYGVGKELTTFDLQKYRFDLVLAYGEYDHVFYSHITQSVIVGNPKFDDWFTRRLDEKFISAVRARLSSDKKNVLYLPTHRDLCSIKDLALDLKKIAVDYNVMVKLHYYTPREEPELVTLLEDPQIILFYDNTDLLPLLHLADVVISDNSSAIFDAILADKPIVMTDFHTSEYLDGEHRQIRTYRRGTVIPQTYSNSIEQRIKRDGTAHTITKPSELGERIAEVLAHDDKRERRRALSQQIFSYRDGRSGERGAAAIRELMDKGTQERPFLYQALERYTTSVLGRPWRGERESLRAEESVIIPSGGIVFSVIVLPCSAEYRSQALRSVSEQDFPKEKYELIELSEEGTLGARVHRAVVESKGKIICFAIDDCILPSSWLSSLYLAYERNPQVGGVGGYIRATKESYTLYDEYRYRALARKLNVPLLPYFLSRLYEVTNQILEQNPAGDLRAMSYRKDALPSHGLDQITHPLALELYLKNSVMEASPLCFIPRKVSRLSKISGKEFRREQSDRNLFWRLLYKRYPQFRLDSRSTVFYLADSLGLLLRGRWLLGGIVLVGQVAACKGSFVATLVLLRERMEYLRDKSLQQ